MTGVRSHSYLVIYNFLQHVGWSWILVLTLAFIEANRKTSFNPALLWEEVHTPLCIFQTAAALEVFHCLFGLVKSNTLITLMQVASRLFVTWGILWFIPESRQSLGLLLVVISWSLTEAVRYIYYVVNLLDTSHSIITWTRYSFFVVLYPTGLSGELLCMTAALPYIDDKIDVSFLPTFLRSSIFGYNALVIIMLLYIPFENDVLLCFHYRHRPEHKFPKAKKFRRGNLEVAEEGWFNELLFVQRNRKNVFCSNISENEISEDQVAVHNCCIIKVSTSSLRRFLKTYNQKNWTNKNGSSLPVKCIIEKVYPLDTDSEEVCSDDGIGIDETVLSSLPELRPPVLMPRGNVGTPTATFMQLIQSCQLPSHFITKLGLRFPKYRGKRKYSCVGYDYDTGSEMSASQASGEDEDNDSCEEWERHEALHDDVTSQDRTKERLYEEELEVVWEKGGSGLVFYTDAQFWEQQKGDFDEQTADDWDVDMSGYYENGMGDKDHRDFLDMRKMDQLKDGTFQESVFKKRTPKPSKMLPFLRRKTSKSSTKEEESDAKGSNWEKHSSGVARKVMEKYGWKDGDGLGSSSIGPSDALESEGQHPRKKTGFGYHGEKQIRWMNRGDKRREVRDPDHHIIGTVFDKPCNVDPPEPLLRSNPPTAVTHLTKKFVRQKQPD